MSMLRPIASPASCSPPRSALRLSRRARRRPRQIHRRRLEQADHRGHAAAGRAGQGLLSGAGPRAGVRARRRQRRCGPQHPERAGRRRLLRSGHLLRALDKGEPLRAIYDIYPQNVFNVVSLKGSGITKPADLKGKKVGVYSLASGTRQALQVLLHTAGPGRIDVTWWSPACSISRR